IGLSGLQFGQQGAGGDGGHVNLTGGGALFFNGSLNANALGVGNGGSGDINALGAKLFLISSITATNRVKGSISASAAPLVGGTGDGGSIKINVPLGTLSLTTTGNFDVGGHNAIGAAHGTGNAGSIDVTCTQVLLSGGTGTNFDFEAIGANEG